MGLFGKRKSKQQPALQLRGYPGDPGTNKCLLMAAERGVQLETQLVDIGERACDSPEYRALSPFGKVPCLRDGDFVTSGAPAVLAYLDIKGNGNSLNPKKASILSEQNFWVDLAQRFADPVVTRLVSSSGTRCARQLAGAARIRPGSTGTGVVAAERGNGRQPAIHRWPILLCRHPLDRLHASVCAGRRAGGDGALFRRRRLVRTRPVAQAGLTGSRPISPCRVSTRSKTNASSPSPDLHHDAENIAMADLFAFGSAVKALDAEDRYGATGDLKKTQYVMQLLGFPADADSLKCLLIAGEKGMEVESRVLDISAGEQYSDDYLAISASAMVPALKEAYFQVCGDLAIISFIEGRGLGNRMPPRNAAVLAQQEYWVDIARSDAGPLVQAIVDSVVIAPMRNDGETPEAAPDAEEVASARAGLGAHFGCAGCTTRWQVLHCR